MLSDLRELIASGADLNGKDEQGATLVRDVVYTDRMIIYKITKTKCPVLCVAAYSCCKWIHVSGRAVAGAQDVS